MAYWYLEENYPIRIAVTGGLLLAILEIALEKKFTKHVHGLSKFNFFLILFLGGLSLLGDEGIWFKLQPAFTGVGIFLFLTWRLYQGNGLMNEMVQAMNQNPPPEFLLKSMERHLSVLFGVYGLFMVYVAFEMTTDRWLFFKTIGFYIAFAIFFVFELLYSRLLMRRYVENQKRMEILRNMKP